MLHVFISGQVQGVGFRRYIKSRAEGLNLTGWVKNLPDGRVEAILQGRIQDIDEMVLLCKKGPFLAEVKSLKTEKLPDQKLYSFDIIKE